MLNAMEGVRNVSSQGMVAQGGNTQDGSAGGRRRLGKGREKEEWREGFVRNSVKVAVAVRESPVSAQPGSGIS